MPEIVAMALVVVLHAVGQVQIGFAVLLTYCGCVRISETLALDIMLPMSHQYGNVFVVMLKRSKRGVPGTEYVTLALSATIHGVAQTECRW